MTTENALQLTGVWQNGGISAKLSFCTSINISANLNTYTFKSPTSPSPKTLNKIANPNYGNIMNSGLFH